MVSTMPVCARPELRLAALLLVLLALTGCGRGSPDGAFTVTSLDADWSNGHLALHGEQQIQLSAEARRALLHGVPLTIRTEFILRDAGNQARLLQQVRRFEVRYLPLSEHYRVTGPEPGQVVTYPRLRHALARLARLDLTLRTGALPDGEYELLMRSDIDVEFLPPPMRLPVLFDPAWKHASVWSAWPLTIDSSAG